MPRGISLGAMASGTMPRGISLGATPSGTLPRGSSLSAALFGIMPRGVSREGNQQQTLSQQLEGHDMGTIQSGDSVGGRIKAGEHVAARSQSVDVAPIAVPLRKFFAVQKSYVGADAKVKKESERLALAERALGEGDALQDGSLNGLALAYVNAGAKRTRPFDGLGVGSPSDIIKLAAPKEAKVILKLADLAEKHADAGVKKAGAAARKAATAVLAKEKPIADRVKARTQAMTARDGLSLQWEKAFASLKIAARAADDAQGTKLFEALFSER